MARMWLTVLGCLLGGDALAGSGPWTLEPDDMSVYAGVGHYRWGEFAGPKGNWSSSSPIGAPVIRTDAVAIVTYGILRGGEIEARVGYGWSTVTRDDADRCVTLGEEVCDTTQSFLPIDVRFKGRFFDELHGLPFSASLTLGARMGDWTSEGRHRLTALGEGSNDLFALLDVGRTGGIGPLGYSVYANVGWYFRFPVAHVAYLDDLKVPGDDLVASGELMLYPRSWLGLGPVVDFLNRFSGVNWVSIDTSDVDRYTALSITQLKVGGKLTLRSANNISFNLGCYGTLFARNNPGDGFAINVGVGAFIPKKRVGGAVP